MKTLMWEPPGRFRKAAIITDISEEKTWAIKIGETWEIVRS